MSAVNCPKCAKPLPDSVIKGPPRAVVRCAACGADLLWFEGKALLKSSTTTKPTQPKPAPGVPVVSKAPPGSTKTMAKPTIHGMPAAPRTNKPTQPISSAASSPVKKAPIITVGKKDEPKKIDSFPLPGGGQTRPNVISKVQAEVPAAPGPTIDPTGWFDEKGKSKSEEIARAPVDGGEPDALPPAPAEVLLPKALEIEKPVLPPRIDSVADALLMAAPRSVARPGMPGADIPGAELATDVIDSEDLLATPVSQPPFMAAKPTPEAKAEPKVEPKPEPKVEAKPPPAPEPEVVVFAASAPASAPAPTPMPTLAPLSSPAINSSAGFLASATGGVSRRKLAIAGAGLLIVASVGVVLLSRGGKAQPPTTQPSEIAIATPEPAPSGAPPFAPTPAAKPTPVGKPGPAAAPASSRRHGSDNSTGETPRAASPRVSNRKVVLEFDPKPHQLQTPEMGPAPAGADPKLLDQARETYHRGNWSLFVGNNYAAVDAYHQTLKIYPGYIAGYRGLGLAYEELGKKKEALEALKTYVKTVPSAHDVSLIKRRIERIERSFNNQKR